MNKHLSHIQPTIFQWQHHWSWGEFIKHLLAAFGILWLLIGLVSFFSPDTKEKLSSAWVALAFCIIGVCWAIYSMRPRISYRAKLCGRDVTIEIRKCDAFDVNGALIVPINRAFDTDLGGVIKRAPSIQGKLLREYYDGKNEHLSLDIQEQLIREEPPYEVVSGKTGNISKYEVGTVVRIRKGERNFYLLAYTDINEDGRACADLNNLRDALAKLWYYISEKGDLEDIVIPVLGTGHARLPVEREVIVQDIIRSFVASCTERSYCGKLTIALLPSDVEKHNINMKTLAEFLECICRHTQFDAKTSYPRGIPTS